VRGSKLQARVAPNAKAKVVREFRQFRSDYRPTPLHAFEEKKVGRTSWYHILIPGRPNGQTGWVQKGQATWQPLPYRIVIDLSERTLRLMKGATVKFTTKVAVGAPGMETPTGRFYVQSGFDPELGYLGAYAFETSAYSKLSDWPGGGIVGIHGWNDPSVMGKAVSHGCVRLTNSAINFLRSRVPVGTPIAIQQ
jgi:lipoprotein-anchoring transpeptidase ErfK/SrfK